MKRRVCWSWGCFVAVFLAGMIVSVHAPGRSVTVAVGGASVWAAEVVVEDALDLDDDLDFDDEFEQDDEIEISDPLEPVNRFFFAFNDKLYFYALKPVARGYKAVIPKDFRICIRNAYHNLLFPVRFVNNLLQGKFENAGVEASRFAINTLAGVAGLGDPAKNEFGLEVKEEDLGQTFAVYGLGNGIYFCWPLLGPSTVRDTLGFAGDSFLNPLSWVMQNDSEAGLALYTGKYVNNTSLVIGDYEAFLESSFDPYVSLRDAYLQYRKAKIDDVSKGKSIY